MSTDPVIRRGSPDDAAAVARCYRQAYASAVDHGHRTRLTDVDAETVAAWLAGDGVSLVAVIDDEVIGTIRLAEVAGHPTVERLAVVPEHQRDGIATRLLECAEALARDCGSERLRLTTFADHPFLADWYERRGYEEVDCPDTGPWSVEFVSMEKQLYEASGTA